MMKRKHEDKSQRTETPSEKQPKRKTSNQASGYFGDPRLIPRVRQYLSDRKDKPVVNISSMVDHLQKQYGEYRRKKRSAFFKSVEKAYQLVRDDVASGEGGSVGEGDRLTQLESQHLNKKNQADEDSSVSEDSDEKSFSSENPDYVMYEDRNSVNQFLTDMYKRSPKTSAIADSPSGDAGFVIDKQPETRSVRLREVADLPPNKPVLGMSDATEDVSRVGDLPDSSQLEDSVISQGSRVNDADLDTSRVSEVKAVMNPVENSRRRTRKSTNRQNRTKDEGKEKASQSPNVQKSTVTFADVGGNEACLKEICKLLVHMRHPEVYDVLGVTPPRGILLHGPPGCGKTLLGHAIAGELDLPFIKLAAPEVVSGVSGESEEKIRDLFEKAVACAPSVVFIDEIDAITPKRETASKDMEKRIVAQLLSCLDDLSSKSSAHVMVIGASNRPDSLDPALRRAGRFDREISLGIPDEAARLRILKVLCRSLKLSPDFDFLTLARSTPGFVGADLMALAREAAMSAVNRVFKKLETSVLTHNENQEEKVEVVVQGQTTLGQMAMVTDYGDSALMSSLSWLKEQPPLSQQQLENLSITMEDFQSALQHVQPSAKREGFATIPDVTWDDIGALHSVRQELKLSILAPVRFPEDFKALGLTNPPGILLAGPPGCGKTLLAKAVANESGINFISVKGPELLNMYVGESERAVRQVFQRARNSAPCVIFFDELDALCPRRSDSGEGGSSVRVVNQLLTEMDGLEDRKQVFIMGATNRPDIIDPAILRPGRLDKLLYVGLPGCEERLDILNTITRNGVKPKLAVDVNLTTIAGKCDGFTGADLAAVVREASMAALKERIDAAVPTVGDIQVHERHFGVALHKVKPSVTPKDHLIYEKMKLRLQT